MKKWLKKHGKYLVVGLAILAIGIASHGLSMTTEEWKVAAYMFIIAFWVMILLLVLRIIGRIQDWWDKE